MNRLERTLAYVAPVYASRRAQARLRMRALQVAQSYYDGADMGRRGASIRRSGASADTVTARKLPSLRNGSHDLIRNNPHARRGKEAIVSNVIGAGIVPRFKRGKTVVAALEKLARETLDTPAIDVNGQLDYYGLQALATDTMVESGAALIVRRFVDDGFPIRFQVLEPDFIDMTKDATALPGGGRIVQGIQFDAAGRRQGYHLYAEHPGGNMRSVQSVFVPARDVAHLYRIERPGQVHGIPWLAPVMLRLADFADYEEAQLVRQKIAACFAIFKSDPADVGLMQAAPENEPENVEPGIIYKKAPGSSIEFARPPQVTDYKDYAKVSLRAIAAGLGVSYEALAGDLEGVSFSSGRMGWLEFQRNIDRWTWHTVIPQACNPMMQWWLEGAALVGTNVAGVMVRHSPPARQMIAPEREVPARTAAIRSGQTTLPQVAAELGMDIDEMLDEIKQANQMLDERNIVLDSDPRKVSAAGLTQARAGESLTFPATGDPEEGDE